MSNIVDTITYELSKQNNSIVDSANYLLSWKVLYVITYFYKQPIIIKNIDGTTETHYSHHIINTKKVTNYIHYRGIESYNPTITINNKTQKMPMSILESEDIIEKEVHKYIVETNKTQVHNSFTGKHNKKKLQTLLKKLKN